MARRLPWPWAWSDEKGSLDDQHRGDQCVLVDDQSKALRFYTEVLGLDEKQDVPLEDARWLTMASPAAPDGVELLVEPAA